MLREAGRLLLGRVGSAERSSKRESLNQRLLLPKYLEIESSAVSSFN